MKTVLLFLSIALLSQAATAKAFTIPLSNFDHWSLAHELSKLPYKYRSEEIINIGTYSWLRLKKYSYLDKSKAFSISCSEKFYEASTVGGEGECSINFDYALSDFNSINVYDGPIENIAIAEIKDQQLAQDLYESIGFSISHSVFFNSKEYVSLVNPTTGVSFNIARLRIDCKRDASYTNYRCIISAVK